MFGGHWQHFGGDEQTFRDFEGQLERHLPESGDNEDSDSEDKDSKQSESFGEVEFCEGNAKSDLSFMIIGILV